jgi:drug/metabolite transporter (DMT)-like permease
MATPLLLNLSLAYACYFINDFLIKFYAPKVDTFTLIRRRTYFTLAFGLVWLIASETWKTPPSLPTLLQVVGLAIICGIGLFFFVKANQHLSFPNVMALNLVGLVTQQFVAYTILQEQLKSSFLLSILLILIGVFTLATMPELKKGIIYALLSTFLWSLGYSLLSIPLKATSVAWTTLLIEVVILLLFLFGSNFSRRNKKPNTVSGKSNWLFPIMGLLTICGSMLFNHAYQNYQVSQVSLVYMLFYPLSVIVGHLYYGERLARREWIGNLLVLSGVLYFVLF